MHESLTFLTAVFVLDAASFLISCDRSKVIVDNTLDKSPVKLDLMFSFIYLCSHWDVNVMADDTLSKYWMNVNIIKFSNFVLKHTLKWPYA